MASRICALGWRLVWFAVAEKLCSDEVPGLNGPVFAQFGYWDQGRQAESVLAASTGASQIPSDVSG